MFFLSILSVQNCIIYLCHVKQRNVCVVYDSFMVWCSSSSVLYSIIDAFTLIKVVPHSMQIYKVWSKSSQTELIFHIYRPGQKCSHKNKYRHVIGHSGNVGFLQVTTVCSFRGDCRHSGGTYYLNLHLVSWGWEQHFHPELC